MQEDGTARREVTAAKPAFRVTHQEVHLLVTLTLLAGGLALSVFPFHYWCGIAGSVMTAVGGVGLSWTLGNVSSDDQAIDVLRPRLETISRHLATTSADIAQVVSEVQARRLDADKGVALVYQANNQVYAAIHELLVLTGRPLDSKPLFQTSDIIDELGEKFSAYSSMAKVGQPDSEATRQLAGEFQSLLQQAKRSVQLSPQRRVVKAVAECPSCGAETSVTLGVMSGDSAMAYCPGCDIRFHAHRASDGSVFARKWGSNMSDLLEREVPCPSCQQHIRTRVLPTATTPRVVYCLSCYERLELDQKSASVLIHRKTVPLDAKVVAEELGRSVLECAKCGSRASAFCKRDGLLFAVCGTCDGLLRASFAPIET